MTPATKLPRAPFALALGLALLLGSTSACVATPPPSRRYIVVDIFTRPVAAARDFQPRPLPGGRRILLTAYGDCATAEGPIRTITLADRSAVEGPRHLLEWPDNCRGVDLNLAVLPNAFRCSLDNSFFPDLRREHTRSVAAILVCHGEP